ncbi:hypothetical protein GCM10028806_16050 [Spirosoma terrae]|uniref:Crassvirus muzzle protein N-terminal region domain-containing protein n=1 Tax=Spirosoma terrae TaxID=1968276 RepID=A0A6L9L904_9BACT|nr:hypothetical protein [Spirosoma terrae]NDU95253.1 hypothetical protein [Spirosoma terrae]
MTQRHTQYFSKGQLQDISPSLQPDGTYRSGRNVRLLYNVDPEGDPKEGRSLALEVMAGTSPAYSLPDGYWPLGEIDTDLGLAVLSTNGMFSEIGLVDPDSYGVGILPAGAIRPKGFAYVYYTLYNDQYDPNNERLELYAGDHIQLTTITENELITRIQWVDGVDGHGIRTLNLNRCWEEGGGLYHRQIQLGSLTTYPRHLSIHQMMVMPEVNFGSLDYERRIDGNLLSGGYQITYRYRTLDGHASPWAPITTRPYFVSDKPIPTNPSISHHVRYMGASGVATQDGLRFVLAGVDSRWNTLEVAVLYHRGSVGVERALLTQRIELDTLANDLASIPIEVKTFSGTALNTAEFLSQQQSFERVQSIASLNSRLYAFNVDTTPALAVDASQVSTEFCEQLFTPDTTAAPTFKPKPNPENPYRQDGDKLTNSLPETVTRQLSLYNTRFGGKVFASLPIIEDYNHNKGVQVATRLAGYRRGETYGFAAVCRDTRGIPYFATPLADITFPDWSGLPPARDNKTVQVGAVFNNIKLPKSMVYARNGKRRLGSIEIVRTQASGRLDFQALAINCTVNVPENSTTAESDQGYKKIEPHASWNNGFRLANTGIGGGPSHYGPHWTKTENTNIKNQGAIVEISFKGRTNDPTVTINKSYWATLHAPDVLTTGILPDLSKSPSSRLEMLGAAHGSQGNEIRLTIAELLEDPIGSGNFVDPFPSGRGGPLHIYTKNYKTNGQLLAGGDANGRPKLGDKTRIKSWFLHNQSRTDVSYSNIDTDNDKLIFSPYQSLFPQYREGAFAGTNQPEYRIRWGTAGNPRPGQKHGPWNFVDAFLAPGTIVACLKDWEAVDVIESPDSYVSLAIVNHVKSADPQPAADERSYYPTGYFLPITDEVLAELPIEADSSGQQIAYILSGVEVFGGDTYVNLVDLCRLYPLWDNGCERRNSYTPDFGVGHIVPMESKFNYALRQGRSLANNAMYSQEAACENRFLHATNGIAFGQPEEWNINEVLVTKETIAIYKPLPSTVILAHNRKYSIYVSQPKLYGERDDSFRQWRPADYYDLDGTKGEGVRMEVLLGGLYAWQERDYGRVRARDRAIIPTSVGELTTGTGKDLDGIDYAGQGVGLHEFNALSVSADRAYWIDSEQKLLCRFSQAGKDDLSDRGHAHDLFTLTLPDHRAAKFSLGVDHRSGDVWITYGQQLVNQTRTVLYNEKLDVFIGEQDCQPARYTMWRGKLYGIHPGKKHQIHVLASGAAGIYFDQSYLAEVEWIVNPQVMYPKVFDNAAITLTGRDALVSMTMRTQTDQQIVDLRPGVDYRVAFRQGQLWFPLMNLVPRDGDVDPRLRDQYLIMTLSIDSTQLSVSDRFTLTGADTLYRLSPRY